MHRQTFLNQNTLITFGEVIYMMGCPKCQKVSGVLLLLLGIVFLLRDLNMFAFWNIQWWSALFILMGVVKLAMSTCAECQRR